jgi:hypothetical protein
VEFAFVVPILPLVAGLVLLLVAVASFRPK